ncbi:MAG: bifunctional tRNA (5-methylaminomethyl-2-thiouridine)(34)-methyltransferase MnmD/FAD-dependent 5-carboxymethylaminomethyl-2-thiouridine(34) oxidoreductase MnmC [Cellvibrionaceae bacterium]|nr:bifunctional tRNA (5-methylaminomethyl-2-thiouridine)(34)-methyltransferase MnmD/FAD-dependent 5-carboxymethylaminomethyl-2-thiouridine(34) oxidoreductase MnmC [Cellvibrionaceae bacterium]
MTESNLHWDENGQPISRHFDDVYYSKSDGLAESRHNFLTHNFLPQRWAELTPGQVFRVAETGFGTGLNFLACLHLWQQCQSPGRLEFYSVEKYPLTLLEISRALSCWPELAELSAQLLAAYPAALAPGWQRIELTGARLNLFSGDALEGFEQLQASQHPLFAEPNQFIDAWFLDGFAPAKNPDMWCQPLFAAMAKLSRPGASYATFSVAGTVRRGLGKAGFSTLKGPGFGHKREMLYGQLETLPSTPEAPAGKADWSQTSAYNSPYPAPWYLPDSPSRIDSPQSALIIGGGIAGCSSARALLEAGLAVTLLERHDSLASEGSGNPQGVLYAKLSHRLENLSLFNLHALLYAQRFYQPLIAAGAIEGDLCGLIQLALNHKTAAAQRRVAEFIQSLGGTQWCQQHDASALSKLAGIDIDRGGLYFPGSGWLRPASVCQWLLRGTNLKTNSPVAKLRRSDGQWQAIGERGQLLGQADIAVIANANDARQLSQTQNLPLKPVRGQVSYAAATDNSRALQTVLCGQGYIAPAAKGQHCLGASFNLHERGLALKAEEQAQNYRHLSEDFPSLASALGPAPSQLNGRAALRCTSPDYLPLVGPVPAAEAMAERFALLGRNARASVPKAGCYQPGLFVNLAHGSRGICYAPLAAAGLASWVTAAPQPMGFNLSQALHPARFLIRDLIRGKSHRD